MSSGEPHTRVQRRVARPTPTARCPRRPTRDATRRPGTTRSTTRCRGDDRAAPTARWRRGRGRPSPPAPPPPRATPDRPRPRTPRAIRRSTVARHAMQRTASPAVRPKLSLDGTNDAASTALRRPRPNNGTASAAPQAGHRHAVLMSGRSLEGPLHLVADALGAVLHGESPEIARTHPDRSEVDPLAPGPRVSRAGRARQHGAVERRRSLDADPEDTFGHELPTLRHHQAGLERLQPA
jgi:hypothetical protein